MSETFITEDEATVPNLFAELAEDARDAEMHDVLALLRSDECTFMLTREDQRLLDYARSLYARIARGEHRR